MITFISTLVRHLFPNSSSSVCHFFFDCCYFSVVKCSVLFCVCYSLFLAKASIFRLNFIYVPLSLFAECNIFKARLVFLSFRWLEYLMFEAIALNNGDCCISCSVSSLSLTLSCFCFSSKSVHEFTNCRVGKIGTIFFSLCVSYKFVAEKK